MHSPDHPRRSSRPHGRSEMLTCGGAPARTTGRSCMYAVEPPALSCRRIGRHAIGPLLLHSAALAAIGATPCAPTPPRRGSGLGLAAPSLLLSAATRELELRLLTTVALSSSHRLGKRRGECRPTSHKRKNRHRLMGPIYQNKSRGLVVGACCWS